jgi:hypothetical protein
VGTAFFDVAIDDDTAVGDVSTEVLGWLGWLNAWPRMPFSDARYRPIPRAR